MFWFASYSEERKRAFIVDDEGFTVIGPCLSYLNACEICRKHNQLAELARQLQDFESQFTE